jgi:molybdopterin synthase catalytic subunit
LQANLILFRLKKFTTVRGKRESGIKEYKYKLSALKSTMEVWKTRRINANKAWIDYQKALDSAAHSCLQT